MRKLESIKVRMMFDRHVHFRNKKDLMSDVAPYTFAQCSAAIIMPNTDPVIDSIDRAVEYKKQIEFLPTMKRTKFFPHLALYLTDSTNMYKLEDGYRRGIWATGKLYPSGTTTNSKNGVTDIRKIWLVLGKMEEIGTPLSLHGEVAKDPISLSDSDLNLYYRERVFVRQVLPSIRSNFPELKIILEHVSTKEAVDFVIQNKNIWATVTAHHLMKDETVHGKYRDVIDPFYFCYPVLNSKEDCMAIRKAVTSEDENVRKKFGAGTDSAPHPVRDKLKGKGGLFTAPIAIELYTQVFVEENAKLGYLNDFLAVNLLKDVYGIPPVRDMYTTLIKEEWTVPMYYNGVRPFMAGEKLSWKILEQTSRNGGR